MSNEAISKLIVLASQLDQSRRSAPPTLGDVFIVRARTPDATDLKEVIQLSLESGISREKLIGYLQNMEKFGSITEERAKAVLKLFP